MAVEIDSETLSLRREIARARRRGWMLFLRRLARTDPSVSASRCFP